MSSKMKREELEELDTIVEMLQELETDPLVIDLLEEEVDEVEEDLQELKKLPLNPRKSKPQPNNQPLEIFNDEHIIHYLEIIDYYF